jgi:hypothetical protein
MFGRPQGICAEQGQDSGSSSDDFYDKMPLRKRAIEAELKTGQHEVWESRFYDGSPFIGIAHGWIISRKTGYVSTTRRLDMGSVKVKDDRIALISEAPNHAWGLMPLEYVVVPWDQQVFLVEPDELLAFCNDVNSGLLRRHPPYGRHLLRVQDFHKDRPTGFPQVPIEYKEYLLRGAITGTVAKTGDDKQDVAVRGEKLLMSGTSVTLGVGKKDGVRTGMRFYPEREAKTGGLSRFFVISLTDRECEVLQCGRDPKDLAKVGQRLSTRDPSYDQE